jgi:DNA-directed RNA polymerase beta subunit
MSSAELVARHEEPEEFGGYFIINGNERLIRYLILPRRNHVISIFRQSWTGRGPSYTPYAVQIRGVRPDQTSVTNTLHYLANGSAMLRFSWRKQEYVVPIMLILKGLLSASDKEIFEGIMMQDTQNTFLTDRVELLLRSFKMYALKTPDQCLEYLGDKFRVVLNAPEDWNNKTLGIYLINKMVLVHLDDPRDKFRMLLCVTYSAWAGALGLNMPQFHAPQAFLLRFWELRRRQRGLAGEPRSVAAGHVVRDDHQGAHRRGTLFCSERDLPGRPATRGFGRLLRRSVMIVSYSTGRKCSFAAQTGTSTKSSCAPTGTSVRRWGTSSPLGILSRRPVLTSNNNQGTPSSRKS